MIHDAGAPTWPRCERLWQAVQSVAPSAAPIPVTWLVVPRLHWAPSTPAFIAGLHEAVSRGDELALHGYSHVDAARPRHPLDWWLRRIYTRAEGEFAGLDEAEALRRLAAARGWFESHGLPPARGFVAPAWLCSPAARAVLERAGFDYLCFLAHIDAPGRGRRLSSLAHAYSTRSAWRRQASIAWNAVLARVQTRAAPLRLELHPGDAEHANVRRAWMRRLEAGLRGGPALTLGGALDALQDPATTMPPVSRPSATPASTSLG
ncbi:DUF2334 domain-containing protein [Caldimonas sp. KR1-144]|uniref:DUF2334 domain-containing protein n=1 Tax=Caldimonas sp. KR1-144 TaxID=3400911 RepID=UPI003C0084F4